MIDVLVTFIELIETLLTIGIVIVGLAVIAFIVAVVLLVREASRK